MRKNFGKEISSTPLPFAIKICKNSFRSQPSYISLTIFAMRVRMLMIGFCQLSIVLQFIRFVICTPSTHPLGICTYDTRGPNKFLNIFKGSEKIIQEYIFQATKVWFIFHWIIKMNLPMNLWISRILCWN